MRVKPGWCKAALWFHRAAVAATLSLPASVPGQVAPKVASLDPTIAAALRVHLDSAVKADRFAGTVLIGRLGDGAATVLFSGAYGLADRERKTPNTIDTRFRIGSMNKMFTAVSIMQLVQAKKIKLTDPVGKYIRDYPNQDVANKVTIHHLLTHTGGTGDFFGPEYFARRGQLRTHDDYIKLLGWRPPQFAPGSRFAYSNYGMIILGAVIERVSGRSYYDYVADNVYKPAGMARSGSEPETASVTERAVGYTHRLDTTTWKPTDILGYRGTAAGGGYSTVRDLLAFAAALMSHKLLDEEHTNLLITGKVQMAPGVKYAYGFGDSRANGTGSVGHNGGAPGMNGDLRIYTNSGYVVAVLSNLDPPAAGRVAEFLDERIRLLR